MKALILKKSNLIENNPLKLKEIPEPRIASNELLVRVSVCGICHTDLHVVEGELPGRKVPVVPGHQIIGRVEAVGSKVKRFRAGARVGIPWLNSTCGECKFCKSNRENLCSNAKFTGYNIDGGFAEYVKIHENFAYSIPTEFTDENATPLLCAGVIGFRAFRLTESKKGDILGLFGFGASAHIVLQVAKYMGIKVFVFSRSENHRGLARDLGSDWTGTINDKIPEMLNSAIIFAPAGEIVPMALARLDRGGRLILAGIHMSPLPQMEYNLLYHERSIKSVANSTRQDVVDFLKIAIDIQVKTEVQIFSIDEGNKALQMLKEGRINGAGVLRII